MKILSLSALMLGTAILASGPAMAGTCTTGCRIESKTPVKAASNMTVSKTAVAVKTVPGKKAAAVAKPQFNYSLVCIDDGSGDEVHAKVTAADDKTAQALAQKKC